jgi:RNA polymerase sigma-54 factor
MLNLQTKQKQSLQLSLKLWLPLLQSPLQELEQIFKEKSYENPFLEVSSRDSYGSHGTSSSEFDKRGFIENNSYSKNSLYDKLLEQICAPLFPTPNSQKVAFEIINHISHEGYFEGDIEQVAIACNTTNEFAQSVRKRFANLEPYGVGAVDMKESLLFQLSNLELSSELDLFVQKLIENMNHLERYYKHHLFEEAKNIIKKLNTPPALEYLGDDVQIIPDFFVDVEDDIIIKINNNYYPDVVVSDPFDTKNSELKDKLKEARDMVNLLELRKSTLYKLVLIIVEKQISFFIGSELKPLTMAVIADELGFDESTISRAVSNKYIQCKRGIFSLKSFFTNEVSSGLSSSEIKNYISNLVENESKETPLTDEDLVALVMKRYDIEMVRRTITKYRKLLDIPSSKERKKIYKIS